jgi:hypothetical protein
VELEKWHTFDQAAVVKTAGFESATSSMITLIARYPNLMQSFDDIMVINVCKQPCSFRFVVAEKCGRVRLRHSLIQ